MTSGFDRRVRPVRDRSVSGAHSQLRRGNDEKTPVWFCCDWCSDAHCHPCWMRHLRRGWTIISPRRPVWFVSTGLLARSWKAGVLDTTGAPRPVRRMPAKLSPWATGGLVLGGLCRIGEAPIGAGSNPRERARIRRPKASATGDTKNDRGRQLAAASEHSVKCVRMDWSVFDRSGHRFAW